MRYSAVAFLAVFFALCAIAGFAASPAEDHFRVIQTKDEAHKLLPKTCEVCHKDQKFGFFLVTSSDPKQLEEALKLLSAGSRNVPVASSSSAAAAEAAPDRNPHAMSTCIFCHVNQPSPDEPVEEMEFRTVSGTSKGPANEQELCRLCHPSAGTAKHAKIYSSGSRAMKDLELVGLKLYGGQIICTTCHDMHDPEAKRSSLRRQVMEFFRLSQAAYPHGRKVSCLACHPTEQQPGTTARFLEPDGVKMCTRCHSEDHPAHRYGMANTEKTYPMDFLAFPLEGGKLVCTTCHDEPCYGKPSEKNRRMLRGGPYYKISLMCDKCHPKAGNLAVNPHNQIDSRGKTIPSVCVFCHAVDPWGGEYGPGNMNYAESPTELCLNCHSQTAHPSQEHLVWMDEKRTEKLNQYESRHQVKMPLAKNNLISCYTCHNPHGKGVLSGAEALGAGETKYLRIPSFAEICTPCHQRYD